VLLKGAPSAVVIAVKQPVVGAVVDEIVYVPE
jgi:hypothetical protein